jgi:hypothetical protein
MNATLQRLSWLGKGFVLCAVVAAAGFYVFHAQKEANPSPQKQETQEGGEGYTVDLNLAPEVVEFEGFINYGTPINTSSVNSIDTNQVDANGKPITIMLGSKNISQPVFSTRKLDPPKP